jgi:acyl-CoA reductase-like NAD-dependent aldehyde dehydrogenase
MSRRKLIWKLADLLEQNADEIAQIESLQRYKQGSPLTPA